MALAALRAGIDAGGGSRLMSLLIGQTAGALGFLTSLSSGLGSSGATESTSQNFAQAANSSTAGVTNPLATGVNPLLNNQVRNAPLPGALAPDTINALFAAQSPSSPPAGADGARDIASLQSEATALSTSQSGEVDAGAATAGPSADSSQGTIAPPSASNLLDQLMQHQGHALGLFTGQSVSMSV
jgi:hypothetical protein